MPQPPLSIEYRNVTQHPDAQNHPTPSPELREALIQLGFKRVGLLEFRAVGKLDPQQLKLFIGETDADLMLDQIKHGGIDEILADSQQQTFALVDEYFGEPIVCLRTLMHNGIVVETVMKPTRAPAPSNMFSKASIKNTNMALRMSMGIATRLIVGKPSLWTYENAPQSGYYVELVDTRDVATLWQRHQQQTQALLNANRTHIRPHTSLPRYLCIQHRARQITEHMTKWNGRLSNGIMILMVLVLVAFPIATVLGIDIFPFYSLWVEKNLSELSFIILTIMLPILSIIICSMLLMMLSRTVIVPRWFGLPLQPAPELLNDIPKLQTLSTRPLWSQTPTQVQIAPDSSKVDTVRAEKWRAWADVMGPAAAGAAIGGFATISDRIDITKLNIVDGIKIIGLSGALGIFKGLFFIQEKSWKFKALIGGVISITVQSVYLLALPLHIAWLTHFASQWIIGALMGIVIELIYRQIQNSRKTQT